MIEGNGPKWLFDIDSLTQSMNYLPVAAGTIINKSAGIQGELNAGTSKEISQDCIVMPIWKDASYFDSPSKDVDNGEPKSATDDQKTIEEEVYATQPLGIKDPDHPDKVYKVVKALYGLHQAPRACQDKYVAEILKKFNYTDVKSASTLVDLKKPLVKDEDVDDVDVHLYRSMIGSLMYLTTSRPDIIYLKGKPTLGLWYSRDSPFELVAYTDSDYARATQDRKSTTGGLQVNAEEDGIFISQDKYVDDILKKFNYTDVKSASTPVDLEKPLVKDRDDNDVDVHLYRSMIGSLIVRSKLWLPPLQLIEYVAAASCCGQIFLQKVLMHEEKKNLLIKNDCLIAECLEKDICSIVLTSDIVVPPSSNCLCEDLRSACDREHTKVLELEAEVLKQQKMVIESEKRNSHLQKNHIDLQLKFQNYKQCIDTSSASNAIFEINKLRKQLQGKDDTIRNLETQINITRMLNVGSTKGSCDQQAFETDRIQLKDTITSLRIQLDGLKVEHVSLQRRYDELSKANTHSRTANTEKLSALTAENTKLKAQVTGKTSSGPSTSEKPKVLASGIYNVGSKYIPPPKRANWVKPSPLPKKKQVTFQEPHRTSTRPTQKPPVQQNKKPNVSVNLPTRTKPATEPRKPMPKSDTRNHRIWPSKSENARRAAIHNRNLNFDHNQFVIRSLKSVNTKTPQAKHNGNHTKKVWKATRKHNVNTTKTAWRPKKVVGSVKPQWRPTGRHFGLFDTCPLTRIVEPIVEPLELTPSVSSSSKVTMISRFTDCKLSDRKAGSKGISGQKDVLLLILLMQDRHDQPLTTSRQIAVSFLSRYSKESDAYGMLRKEKLYHQGIRGTSLSRAGKPVKKVLLMNLSDHRDPTLNTKDYLTKFDPKSYEGVFLGYSQNSKAYIILNKQTMKVEESLNVTFDETPPPPKTSPLEDDELVEEEAIKVSKTKPIGNDLEDNQIVNIKESKTHPLENVIGNLNQRTLRSQAQDKSNFFCFISTLEPKNINEALKVKNWVIVMQKELNQFKTNDVWELVSNPMDMTIIGTKWVYRNKLDKNGVVTRNKARLVAQGYNQQEGIDYEETYAPVARLKSIRILLAYACALDFKLYQMDVKSAFLNSFINEEVYVAQPPGFIDFAKPNYVYKLKKALYGLKQAPKAWYDRLKAFLIKHNYSIGMVDNTLFNKKKDSNLIIVQIYVDDIILRSTCQEMCDDFAKIMHDEFEMSMMGELNFFLGLQIKQLDDGIFFNQSKYIKEMLKKFGLEDSKPIKTPMSTETKLTRDEEGLWYPKEFGIETIVYADSDHAGDYVDRKSTSGVCTFMGCCLTSWFSKKQTALVISTTEAEYVSVGKACQQALWMKQALIDYGVRLDDIPIMRDNKRAIDLSKNLVQQSQTKHIEIHHHFLRDNVQKGNISIEKVSSEDNIIDILTKPLKREPFNYLRLGLGMMEQID
ncbi:retrovirus-related pol polyprotein from transposon TNT 1-94 [Tanacetum coccineum]|uniref:Retrovirus-related pol polyprotein from transposon TNT 1-94 n=1 Tax=Tanacetum coccineum TaxID=301880 RepID=A0ABQ5H6G7_9ASTR